MIVVVGSRHDPVARGLVAGWRGAALSSAEDLVRPGWAWSAAAPVARTWVVEGNPVSDAEVTGVFVRRSAVYPEELTTTHPDDRRYLAAEATAFLGFVLATTSARVSNPVVDGAFGEEAVRPERWMAAAAGARIAVRPVRVRSEGRAPRRPHPAWLVEVVGSEIFGAGPPAARARVGELAEALGLGWGTFAFDGRDRLFAVTVSLKPSAAAAEALGRFLGGDSRSEARA
jgi:hypothetical protein